MANEQNLRPCEYKFTQEDAKKGQINGARKRRERKKFNELFNSFLEKSITDEKLKEEMLQFGFTDEECINKNALVLAQYREASKGNVQAFVAIRDTAGEKPVDQIQNMNPPVIKIERPKDGK